MKNKTTLYAILLLACMAFTKTSLALKGPSCDSAAVLSYPINNSVSSYTSNVYWFKVTLNDGNYSINVATTAGVGKIYQAEVYIGSCSTLTLVSTDSLMAPGDSEFNVGINNTAGSTAYYVKLYNSGGSVSFNKTMASSLNIVGQLGFCPGEQVTLSAYPVNASGTKTYTWQPGGANTGAITFTPTNILTPTTYTLTYNDAGGTKTATVNIFPLGPNECKNCEQVQNGHFEWYNAYSTMFSNITASYYWNNANTGTSDYFNSNFISSWVGVPANYFTTNTPAHSGNGYSGFCIFSSATDTREYIQAPLKCALVPGQLYNISFYTTLADRAPKASNNLGAYLSTTPVYTPNGSYLNYTPQVNSSSVINYSSSWTQVSGTMSGNNEQYITIGNFYSDAGTSSANSTSTHTTSALGAFSYYFVDDVSVTPVPPTLYSSSDTVACNCVSTITLTATGSPSVYTSWTNGTTTYTGSVVSIPCPSVTTTYTCSVDLPCANCLPFSNTITVWVSASPTITAVASPTSICAGSTTTLTASGASTYTWMPGSTTGSTLAVTPSVTTVYTVTGTNTLGCTSIGTVTVTVNSTYCCQSPVKTFTTGTWSSQTASTTVGAILISVTGVLTINANVTFAHTIIRMAPNAKIIVDAGRTVNLNSAHLFSCDYMWEGIEMSNNSVLNTNRAVFSSVNPTLDDAYMGVHSDASAMGTPATISLNYLELSKNHIGVKVENYTGTSAYPFSLKAVTVQGNVGTTYSPGTTLKTYLSPGPINYTSTDFGVLLEDVNAAIVGSTNGARNTFKSLFNGVRLLRSNAHVLRNDFLDLNTGYNNRAIWAAGDNALNPAVISPANAGYGTKHRFRVGTGTSNHCTFKNLKYGVFTDSCMTSYIENNDFKDIHSYGIAVHRANFYRGLKVTPVQIAAFYDRDTSYIYKNTMAPSGSGSNLIQNGTGYFDNSYLFGHVTTNTISLKPASGVPSDGIGIYYGSTNTYAQHLISENKITGTGNYGVHQQNIASTFGEVILSNTITVANGSWSPFSVTAGIFSDNSPYSAMQENIIDETGISTPVFLLGIYINNGQQDYIGCNLIKNTSASCFVNLNNVSSTFKGNVMDVAYTGLNLQNGTMGDIGASGDAGQNEWYTIGGYHTFVSNSTALSRNIYYDNSIGARNPTTNGFSAAVPFTPVLTTAGSLGCTQHHKGGSSSQIQPSNYSDAIVTDLITGNVQFPQYNEGLLWEHQNGILSLLKDSLLDNENAIFSQFRQQQENSNLGRINSLMRSVGNYDGVMQNKTAYLQELGNINTLSNVVEQNYYLFLSEYLNNIAGQASIEAGTYSNMRELAQKCPYSDGAVVYNARGLMKIWGDETVYHNSCEDPALVYGDPSRKSNSIANTENVLVYPNPNNGMFNISYTFKQNGQEFVLYDVVGKEIMRSALENNEGTQQLSNSDLNAGIYFYKIMNANNVLFTGKLVIHK